ncbi:MAG: hypothetical protein FWF85_07920 [Clostridiales bacterium]|nr:hypothetical protein [Clostridiales bacterium]
MKKLISLLLIVILLMNVLPMTTFAVPVPIFVPDLEFDLDAVITENSPELMRIIAFAEGQTSGYGSNGKFLEPIESPNPDGTKIYTEQDLWNIRNNLSGSYVLMNDLDLSKVNDGQWVPIGDNSTNSNASMFTGVFDGQGHIIKNLTITGDTYRYAGLFGCIGDAEIKNVCVEDTYIDIYYPVFCYAGGICGFSSSSSYISSSISNCYNTGDISSSSSSASSHAGGICGYSGSSGFISSSSSISNCYSTGDVSSSAAASSYAGGICGRSGSNNYSPISNCYNTGDISSSSYSSDSSDSDSYAGGICGYNMSAVSYCYNTGAVSSSSSSSPYTTSYAGGICSYSYSSISNCYNTGAISSTSYSSPFSSPLSGSEAGGICGYNNNSTSSSISNCYNKGAVSSFSSSSYSSFAGGIISISYSYISNCYNTGAVSCSSSSYSSYAGGICGNNINSTSNCYNTGAVSSSAAHSYAGGICGSNSRSSISNSRLLSLKKLKDLLVIAISALFVVQRVQHMGL